MRVLMLSWEYPPYLVGGLGKHVMELVPALARRPELELHLVTPRWFEAAYQENVQGAWVHRVDLPTPGQSDVYEEARRVNHNLETFAHSLWEEVGGFDLVHVHDWLVAFAAWNLKHRHRVPLLATIHATEHGRRRGFLTEHPAVAIHQVEQQLVAEARRVIACSHFMRDELQRVFGLPQGKVDVIPNGVNVEPFQYKNGRDLSAFRARYARPGEQLVFNVGRLVHEKGAHLLMEAIPTVLEEFPHSRFVIAGRGNMREVIQKRAEALHLDGRVLFTGYISDEERNRLYAVADVAVFPSLYEPFGIVALEAMAARCPVVVSGVGGLGEVVQHDVTGVTVFPGDPMSLAWGIRYTLRDREAAQRRIEAAYRLVTEQYNWGRIAAQTAAVYQRIVAERARGEG